MLADRVDHQSLYTEVFRSISSIDVCLSSRRLVVSVSRDALYVCISLAVQNLGEQNDLRIIYVAW